MKLEFYSYRYADAVLKHDSFRRDYKEFEAVLRKAGVPLLPDDKIKHRKRDAIQASGGLARYFFLPVDQGTLNGEIAHALPGWQKHPLVVPPEFVEKGKPAPALKADFKRGKLQIEVQFGNMARWYTDVFKFQLSYSIGAIDVAVLAVPMLRFANLIDENIANFERVVRELPSAKMSLTLPILVIGLEPNDYRPIFAAYDRAFERLKEDRNGDAFKIPATKRVKEEPPPEDS